MDDFGEFLFVAGVFSLAAIGVAAIAVVAVRGMPVDRAHVIEHGCASYVCDKGGDCVFTWADPRESE